jgi:UDP-4-amino-4,6-dideoxy-N-acetyl-beta-L-altrosamine N-acetyltransferase
MCSLINFTNLTKNEKELVLSWRNTTSIQNWMCNKKEISKDEHFDFIESLKKTSDKFYFLVKKDREYLGVVGLNGEYLGVYANPSKKKVGDILLKKLIDFSFNKQKLSFLLARVYRENISAIKLYKRFDFKITEKDSVMFTMELNNDEYS